MAGFRRFAQTVGRPSPSASLARESGVLRLLCSHMAKVTTVKEAPGTCRPAKSRDRLGLGC